MPTGIGSAIKRLRIQRGLSLGEAGQKVGRSRQHIHQIENETHGTPLPIYEEVIGAIRGRLFIDVRPAEEGLEPAWVGPAIAEVARIAERLDEPRRERLLRAANAIASVQDPVALDLAIAVLEHHASAASRAAPPSAPAAEGESLPTRRRG